MSVKKAARRAGVGFRRRSRFRAQASRSVAEPRRTGFDDLAALQALAPILSAKISSRRLAFTLGDEDDEETQIAVIHVQTDEELGFIFAEDGEYVFESNPRSLFRRFRR
jgi:hypothetical protein